MGRRKIEIQPITHERNRSVTFLKRKNGLFKKAYELGVLCSVDVAVIIFEERPGHETRMHQYSSTDIRDIVQRQLRHQGEKDIKTPGDFSGTGGSKFDADGEGDDDDEEDVPMRNTRSKPVTTKSSAPATQPTPSTDPEQAPAPPSRSVQPQPPLLRMDEQTGLSSLLPVSNDRVSSVRSSHTRGTLPNKRPRLSGEYQSSRSRSPSDEGEMNSYKTNGHDLYMGERGPPTRYDDRALRNLGHLGSQLQLSTPYTSSDSLYPTQQQQVYGSSQYADPFSGHASGSSGSSSAAGFLPMNGQDFSQPRGGGGPMSREFGTEYDHGMQSRRYVVGSTYDSPMYSGLLRTTSTSMGPPQQPPPSAQGGGGYGRSGGGGGYLGREDRTDSFSALLEADERSRQQQETGSSDLIWPIHESRGTGGSASDGIGSVAGRTNSAPLSEDTPESNGAGGHWLDFLSSGGSKGGTRSSATTDIASIFGIGNGSGQREAEGSPEEKGDVPSIIVPDGADKEDRG